MRQAIYIMIFTGLIVGTVEACPYMDISREEIAEIIENRARHYEVDPDLIWAMVEVESYFDPCIVSDMGAMGLMQLMPETARQQGVKDPFDPNQSIDAGIRLMAGYLKKYDLLQYALAAYNAGEGAVRRYRRIPPYHQTKHYIRKVVKAYELKKGQRTDWLVWSRKEQTETGK
jgi:soluble lytic murein transglycosylase-like protein